MKSFTFSSTLEQDKDGTWWYVHVPKQIRDQLKPFEHRGIIKVQATIGQHSWNGSLLPWADGSAQLSINKTIRNQEQLQLGDQLNITVKPVQSSV